MKNRKVILLVFSFLLMQVFFCSSSAQERVELQFNNTNEYPEITTAFRLYDANGVEIRNDKTDSTRITEEDIAIETNKNGEIVQREIINISCPDPSLSTVSFILSVDVSTSMEEKFGSDKKIDIVKEVLEDFINSFDPNRTEIAITLFAGDAIGHPTDINYTPFRPFTNNRDELKESLDQIGTLYSGTNWNAAFLMKQSAPIKNLSALYYTRPNVRKYKPVIIFLTDGNHLPNWQQTGPPQIFEIRQQATENNASIYCIQIGDEELTDENQQGLEQLSVIGKVQSDFTPNLWQGVNDAYELRNLYVDILSEASTLGDPPPCYVTWKAGCNDNSATFTFPNHGMVTDVTEFEIDEEYKAELQITPKLIKLTDVVRGSTSNQSMTLTAVKGSVEIDGLEFLDGSVRHDGKFKVTDWGSSGQPPFTIEKDSSYEMTIEYTPTDSLFSQAHISFISSACSSEDVYVQGYMNPFVEDVDFGDVDLGSSKDTIITQVFCNKTGNTININSIMIDGNDKADFEIISFSSSTIGMEECIEVSLRFTPSMVGQRYGTLVIDTDFSEDSYEGVLIGNAKDTISSVNEEIIEEQDIIVYPNPAKDNLKIRLNETIKELLKNETVEISIVNNMGVVLSKQTVDNIFEIEEIDVDINKFISGTYFLKVQSRYLNRIVPVVILK